MTLSQKVILLSFSIVYLVSAKESLPASNQDDDLEFIEENASLPGWRASINDKVVPVERQWGVPDARAVVGRLFHSQIPPDAFVGHIDHFEIVNQKGKTWPKWLDLSKNGVLKGVPDLKDVGEHYLVVKAIGPHGLHNSKDIFAIEVLKPGLDSTVPAKYKKGECVSGVDPIMLSIVLDGSLADIEPKKRVTMLENFSGYFGIPVESLYLHEQTTPHDLLSLSQPSFFTSGSGNVLASRDKKLVSLSFQIGCGQAIDDGMRPLLERTRTESQDGTLAEVLQQGVISWHARSELPAFFRDRRDAGSGDFYEEEDEEEDYNEGVTTVSSVTHAHRHHHGEEGADIDVDGREELLQPSEVHYQRPSTSLLINYENILSTPLLIPERPTVLSEGSHSSSSKTFTILPTKVMEIDVMSSVTDPRLVSSETANETLGHSVTVPISMTTNDLSNETELLSVEVVTSNGATPTLPQYTFARNINPNDVETTLDQHITTNTFAQLNQLNGTWSTSTGTTISTTEEDLESESKNFPPTIAHRLKKVAIVAGKVLHFKIPDNTFLDIEDGDTSHLMISFKTIDEKNVPIGSWIAFNTSAREIIALPLEEHVSKWEFLVEARDKDGDTVTDSFELQVQQHKGTRAVNHEFTVSLSVNQGVGYSRALDWQLAVVNALVKVYGDVDASQLTVRSVVTTSDPVSFTWTNDTLPRSYCPREEISRLFQYVSPGEDGYPSSALQDALGPGITARRVTFRGIENCEVKSAVTLPPPKAPVENFAPVPRNQIDHINATVGQLLVYKVPEDTFYDPEEGDTRGLKMSLFNMNLTELAPDHWLQFDAKNQEFYGLPMESDPNTQEYQLVCEDHSGLTANDGLVVAVHPRPLNASSATVQFSVSIDIPYGSFARSATLKRRFVEKLREVFGDPNTDAIIITAIKSGSTVVSWINQTLPTDHCPDIEIQRLNQLLVNENENMNERFMSIMESAEFPVISVGLEAAGWCLGEQTVHHKPEQPSLPPANGDESLIPFVNSEDYWITFGIPSIVIAAMLILAALIACFFYRKRRVHTKGIGDDDERQSFRNKGIPVIFQDELEEKPEPENKNPVIMKEEKPPLPPPDYQRTATSITNLDGNRREHQQQQQRLLTTSPPPSDDTPYHPPPPPFPLTGSRDTSRPPKHTPTYRKPPPYVPP